MSTKCAITLALAGDSSAGSLPAMVDQRRSTVADQTVSEPGFRRQDPTLTCCGDCSRSFWRASTSSSLRRAS